MLSSSFKDMSGDRYTGAIMQIIIIIYYYYYYYYHYLLLFFPVALQPNAGHGLLLLEVSRSHTTTHHSR